MKIYRFRQIMALVAMLAAAGCSKDGHSVADTGTQVFPLEISAPVAGKVRTMTTANETAVSSLQVFVFRENGVLEAYGKSDGSKVIAECTSGMKTIVALANAPDITDISDKSSLDMKVSRLEDNRDAFVMYGSYSAEITSASGTVTVPVTRLVARISIQKITNRLSLPQYSNSSVQIKKIYLINVAGDMIYGDTGEYGHDKSVKSGYVPSVWLNKGKCDGDGDMPALLSSGELKSASAAHGSSYTASHYFYCYPNPASSDASVPDGKSGYTRLVVEVSVEGRVFYYPVSIPGIENNHTYNISELVITKLGSEDPNVPVSYDSASFSITVNPWESGSDSSVTI